MADVAARVGVSRQLVSLVLRNAPGPSADARAKILQAADEIGYRPDAAAQMLRRNRSGQLGVLFTLRHPHDVALVEAIYPVAKRRGYSIALGATGSSRDERQAIEDLLSYRIEALVVIGPYVQPAALSALAEQIPVVEISRRLNAAQVDSVRTDDRKGVALAIDHLVELGHKEIVHVDGGTMPGAADRRGGYRVAMRRHGLSAHTRVIKGEYNEESGAAAARLLLASGDLPTAIVAGNDRCAIGLMQTLIRVGVNIPGDVSVIGYDDSQPASLSYIDLTSVRQDAVRLAELAVDAIAERLDEGRTATRDIVLKPQLIIRRSTAAPRTSS